MDRSTGSTAGPNCDTCVKGPPGPTVPPVPPPPGSLACGFESGAKPYCGLWNDASGDQQDFTRKAGSTPSGGTGPSKAVEGHYYMYYEASGRQKAGDKAILQTIKKVALKSGADLEFDWHMFGATMGSLEVFVDSDSVWKMSGDQGNQWQASAIKLDKYAGKSVNIKFVASRGGSWSGDVAIDDIILIPGSDGAPAPTPAGTPTPTPASPCADYCSRRDCSWTRSYSCPWTAPIKGVKRARPEQEGYKCCCELRTAESQPCGGPAPTPATAPAPEPEPEPEPITPAPTTPVPTTPATVPPVPATPAPPSTPGTPTKTEQELLNKVDLLEKQMAEALKLLNQLLSQR